MPQIRKLAAELECKATCPTNTTLTVSGRVWGFNPTRCVDQDTRAQAPTTRRDTDIRALVGKTGEVAGSLESTPPQAQRAEMPGPYTMLKIPIQD